MQLPATNTLATSKEFESPATLVKAEKLSLGPRRYNGALPEFTGAPERVHTTSDSMLLGINKTKRAGQRVSRGFHKPKNWARLPGPQPIKPGICK